MRYSQSESHVHAAPEPPPPAIVNGIHPPPGCGPPTPALTTHEPPPPPPPNDECNPCWPTTMTNLSPFSRWKFPLTWACLILWRVTWYRCCVVWCGVVCGKCVVWCGISAVFYKRLSTPCFYIFLLHTQQLCWRCRTRTLVQNLTP